MQCPRNCTTRNLRNEIIPQSMVREEIIIGHGSSLSRESNYQGVDQIWHCRICGALVLAPVEEAKPTMKPAKRSQTGLIAQTIEDNLQWCLDLYAQVESYDKVAKALTDKTCVYIRGDSVRSHLRMLTGQAIAMPSLAAEMTKLDVKPKRLAEISTVSIRSVQHAKQGQEISAYIRDCITRAMDEIKNKAHCSA